jgi:integrase
VPLLRFLADELAEHLVGKKPDDLVFHITNRRRSAKHKLPAPVVRSRGRASRPGGLTPHELRHTAASSAVRAGTNVKVVHQMLGHASAAMTLDVYAGLFADNVLASAQWSWRRLG